MVSESLPSLLVLPAAQGPARIPFTLLIVFVSAKLLAELFERIGRPGIVGDLAGGLTGPSILGWLAPNELPTALSDLGAMFLLFRVGLDILELMKVGGTATLVAFTGVVVPFIMGTAILFAGVKHPGVRTKTRRCLYW